MRFQDAHVGASLRFHTKHKKATVCFYINQMTTDRLHSEIIGQLPYSPNEQQSLLIGALARFCTSPLPDDSVFLVNGYAGTGKSSLTGALVKALKAFRVPVVLLAPTGRAAKVFGAFAGHPASTIHRRIYRTTLSGETTSININNLSNAVFIVDEASMIGNEDTTSCTNLLDDLLQYVFSGTGCRLIMLGDTAQLPPVGSDKSPAMDVATLKKYNLRVSRAVLTDTVRQNARSGILRNATWLRRAMLLDPLPEAKIHINGFDDISLVAPADIADAVSDAYARSGIDDTIIITRSNRRAASFNQGVRTMILDRDVELDHGERLLVAKNNYSWSSGVKELDFIANGDIALVEKVYCTETRYGHRFADVRLHLPDRDIELDCKIILDTLASDTPTLPMAEFAELHRQRYSDPEIFKPETSDTARFRALKSDPYVNALQVKYAYSVTCHKAQGGQWGEVFIDMTGIAPEAQNLDFYRWLYTAVTRATRHLHIIRDDA